MLVTSPYIQYITNQGKSVQLNFMLINQHVTVDEFSQSILKQCREPQSIETLQSQYGKDVITFLCENKLLLPNENIK